MTLTHHGPTRRAFTLVELLVVITIIAVLAGIALPVFNKVQERAKALQDGNNLRQLGLATIAFASDNDGDLLILNTTPPSDRNWPNLLRDTYVKDNSAFHSPFDKQQKNGNLTAADAPVSYGLNSEILGAQTAGKTMDDAKYPSQLLLFAPAQLSRGTFKGTFATPIVLTKASNPDANSGKFDGGTHSTYKRIKIVMLDGHVEDIDMRKFQDDSSVSEGVNRWKFQSADAP